MPEEPKDQPPLINFSEVANDDKPHASSLDAERAERDRKRRAENAAAAKDGKAKPFVATPPD
jgi:hypothetical protein